MNKKLITITQTDTKPIQNLLFWTQQQRRQNPKHAKPHRTTSWLRAKCWAR